MKLLTLSMRQFEENRLWELEEQLQESLQRKYKKEHVQLKSNLDHFELSFHSGKTFELSKHGADFYKWVADELTQFVVDRLEADLLAEWIAIKYNAFEADKQQKLLQYCLEILVGQDEELADEQERSKRLKKIWQAFYHYIERETYIHIAGFIRFRLKDYMDDLKAVIDYAADELLINQQYNEFISLLKYFVYAQETKRAAVHIYHRQGNEFLVLDEHHQPIDTREDKMVMETIDREINLEDMIISTLITVSPQKVYIHTRQPEMQVIRTIQMIFAERAVICT